MYRFDETMAAPGAHGIPDDRVAELQLHYNRALFQDVLPWWQEYSIDTVHGGFLTRLTREGMPYSGDKDIWMVGRQIWMFAHLFNHHDPRSEWLEIAKHGGDFLLKHAFQPNGDMYFRLRRDGSPLSAVLGTYTEVFASIGIAELAKAEGSDQLWSRARGMYARLMTKLGRVGDKPQMGYPMDLQVRLHSHDMCRLTVARVFGGLTGSAEYEADVTLSIDSILSRHWKPELGVLLESVAPDGDQLDVPEGRLVNPGHAIESAWMMMEVALDRQDDVLFATAVDIVLTSLERGWDSKYGGLRYMLNYDDTPTHAIEADCKLWWPHAETLYALLLAWKHTGRADIGRWYERVHDYAFSCFSDLEYGEWFGYLNRDGSRIWTAKANGWKGCFHLPRVLFRCVEALA